MIKTYKNLSRNDKEVDGLVEENSPKTLWPIWDGLTDAAGQKGWSGLLVGVFSLTLVVSLVGRAQC